MARRHVTTAFAAGFAALITAAPATAHPHVWVDVNADLVFKDGKIVGV